MRLDDIKTLTDMVTSLLATVALIVGGAFGAYQYLDKVRDDRVKETLNFLDRYNRGYVVKARVEQQAAWEKHTATEAATPGKRIGEFTRDVIRIEKLESSISVLNDFYDTVRICATNDICDTEVALQLFQEDACVFYIRSYSFLKERRATSGDSKLGLGTELLAKDARGQASVSCIPRRRPAWYERLWSRF